MKAQDADLNQLEKGDELTVTVQRFNNKYLGENTAFSKPILVPATLPGETVRGSVIRNWKQRLLLEPEEIIQPHKDRVQPRCKHFTLCAGCQFQHLDYDRQLELKVQRMKQYFRGDDPVTPLPLREVIASPDPYGYRNNIKLHGPGEPGFWRVRGYDMMRNEECPVCVPEVEQALAKQRENRFLEFGKRGVDNVMIRASSTGEVYVGPEQPGDGEQTWLTEELPHPLREETVRLKVPAHAFWQGSTPMLPRLTEQVARPVQRFEPRVLIETYCGMGLFGLLCSPAADNVVGVEENPLAVRAARRNQRSLELDNLRFIEGKTEDHLESLLRRAPEDHTTLIVDPPRSGLRKSVLKQTLRHPPRHVVYVSCNPDSLARNLRGLCEDVYELSRIVALDMFPQTKHVECVGVLHRR